jgi:hypothetical protein
MNTETDSIKETGALSKVVGIFTSPRETFKSIDQKPTWLVPFLIVVILSVVMQFLVMDIGMKDQIARMEARNTPAAQIEAMQSRMEGPWKYIGVAFVPVAILAVWAVLAGILLFGGNTMMGGETKFKKVFSVMAWSSLVGMVGQILKTFLILSKGTSRGVVTSLAILLPTPELGEKTPILYRFLSRFDLFTIWELIIWIIGLAVIYRFETKKSAMLVLSLWVIWVLISVALGGLLGGMFGG